MSSNIDFNSPGARSVEQLTKTQGLKLCAAGQVRANDLLGLDSIEHMISQQEFGAMQVFTGAQDKGFTHL